MPRRVAIKPAADSEESAIVTPARRTLSISEINSWVNWTSSPSSRSKHMSNQRGEAFLDVMCGIRQGRMRDLDDEGLDVAQQQLVEG